GLRPHFEADPPAAAVRLDRYLYERVAFNLLSNAVKFTPPGGTVAVAVRVGGGRLRLEVRDTGVGIAADDLPHLFQKFRQLEGPSARRFEGSGLGLALVKEFAELLDGTVRVASTPGQGSTFTVECAAPAADAAPAPAEEARPAPRLVQHYGTRPAEAAPAGGDAADDRPTVVLAEDNVEMASYIAGLLHEPCRPVVVRDGDATLDLVRRQPPDLVVADVVMPGRDGLSLCRALKADPATARIPVVLLTALTQRDALLKGWEAGA